MTKIAEGIELVAVPIEWIEEPCNQQRAQKILSDNKDKLLQWMSKHEPEMVPVPLNHEE
jgi:hypothetical protein